MTDEPDHDEMLLAINQRLVLAFQHVYPDLTAVDFEIEHREDETIVVHVNDPEGLDAFPSYRAVIHSDDDGFLRFTPFDEDDEPEDDDHDFISIRIRILDGEPVS